MNWNFNVPALNKYQSFVLYYTDQRFNKYGNTRNEDLKHSFLIRFNTILKVLAELPDI